MFPGYIGDVKKIQKMIIKEIEPVSIVSKPTKTNFYCSSAKINKFKSTINAIIRKGLLRLNGFKQKRKAEARKRKAVARKLLSLRKAKQSYKNIKTTQLFTNLASKEDETNLLDYSHGLITSKSQFGVADATTIEIQKKRISNISAFDTTSTPIAIRPQNLNYSTLHSENDQTITVKELSVKFCREDTNETTILEKVVKVAPKLFLQSDISFKKLDKVDHDPINDIKFQTVKKDKIWAEDALFSELKQREGPSRNSKPKPKTKLKKTIQFKNTTFPLVMECYFPKTFR